jgi:biopolymer transport protein ExbD
MNITPLVDVMLVLLIIFMVAVPMLDRTLVLDFPGTGPTPPPPDEPITLQIDAHGGLILGGTPTSRMVLDAALRLEAARDTPRTLQIEPADGVDYARVADVLAVARRAGVERIAIN